MPDDGICTSAAMIAQQFTTGFAKLDRDNLYEVVLVFNALAMGEGKKAGQAFQASHRDNNWWPEEPRWKEQGTRTIVKIAKTPAIFQRVVDEVEGFVMHDEGFTEVEADAATLFVSRPFFHKDRPKILDNKKLSLL